MYRTAGDIAVSVKITHEISPLIDYRHYAGFLCSDPYLMVLRIMVHTSDHVLAHAVEPLHRCMRLHYLCRAVPSEYPYIALLVGKDSSHVFIGCAGKVFLLVLRLAVALYLHFLQTLA